MKKSVYAHWKFAILTSVLVAGVIGLVQLTGFERLARSLGTWFVIVGLVLPAARMSKDEKMGVVPSVIITAGQAGLLIVPVVVGRPVLSFLAAGLAVLLFISIKIEERATKRSASTP